MAEGSRLLGLIGGMSWSSTGHYYRRLNQRAQVRLGGLHSAPVLLYSVDFAPLEALQSAGDWEAIAAALSHAGAALSRAGAGALLLCTNTMHKVAAEVESGSGLPLLHIVDAVGAAIRQQGMTRVGLLGTRFTMGERFYQQRLLDDHGVHTVVPSGRDQAAVDRIIYEELCRDVIRNESRELLHRVIAGLGRQGAQGVILGCTELPLLVQRRGSPLPVFDTTELHAQAGSRWLAG